MKEVLDALRKAEDQARKEMPSLKWPGYISKETIPGTLVLPQSWKCSTCKRIAYASQGACRICGRCFDHCVCQNK